MGPLSAILIGLAAGFALAVWALLAYTNWQAKHPAMAIGYGLAGGGNLAAVALIFTSLAHPPGVDAGPIGTTAILMTVIGLPAHLALIPWLRARRLGV